MMLVQDGAVQPRHMSLRSVSPLHWVHQAQGICFPFRGASPLQGQGLSCMSGGSARCLCRQAVRLYLS